MKLLDTKAVLLEIYWGLVFTDDDIIVKDIKVTDPLGRSDHGSVNFKCDTELQEKMCKKLMHPYEWADFEKLNRLLKAVDWD